jgi:mono/diheme cytochrome c family protein
MNQHRTTPDRHVRQGMDYGEHEDVQQVHAAIQREKREPRVGLEPLSIWLIAIYGLAVFFGGAYLGRYAGNFTGESLDYSLTPVAKTAGGGAGGDAAPQAQLTSFDRGKKVYLANCATCHQANGQGVGGQYPPLAGAEWVTMGSKRPAMVVLKGLEGPITVKGVQYGSAVMQPWEKTLNDQKIADVLTYIRQEWGNKAPSVAPEGIAALRKEIAGFTGTYREADIMAVPADAGLPGDGTADQPPAEAPKP